MPIDKIFQLLNGLRWINGIVNSYAFWLISISLFCLILERIRPWRSQKLMRPLIFQDFFWLIFNGVLISKVFAPAFKFLNSSLSNIFLYMSGTKISSIAIISGSSFWIQAVFVLIVGDFIEWCVHVLLHRLPFLWKIHRIHHSIHIMDWAGNFRFHWMEPLIYHSIKFIPMRILGARWDVIFMVSVFSTLIGHLNHSNLNISWGRLKYLFNSPSMHIWHHSEKMYHKGGQNFGIVLSVWDWIFKTVYWPKTQPQRIGYHGDDRLPENLVWRFFLPIFDKKKK